MDVVVGDKADASKTPSLLTLLRETGGREPGPGGKPY